jgi:PAS domain S-box-containing protein
MKHSPIYAYIKDVTPEESRVLIASENFIDMIGIKGSEMVGKTMKELFPPEFSEKITADDWKVVSRGYVLRLDEELNGRHYTTIKFPISLGEKNLLAGYTIDVNERKLAEEALIKSRERFRDLIELAVDGVMIGSNEGFIIDANSCFCSLAGRKKEEIIGKHITNSFFTPESLKQSPFRFDLLKKGEVVVNERNILRPDGTEIIIEMRTKMMPDGTYQSIFRDISKRKLDETDIKLKNEELSRLNTEKDKFFSIIAHDLRSPFNGFLGLTEMMAEELSDMKLDDVKMIAVNMRDSAFNLFQLLENLLQWSQIHQGLITLNPEKLKLYQIVNESLSIIYEPAKFKEINIINKIQTDTEVIADRNILQSIIRNLVSNAVKFTNKGGKIILESKINKDKNVEISVKDSGIGMPKDMVDNLFLLNVKTNRPGTEGELSTGLGLILCKEFVEKHGGTISITSKEGKGSTFSFTLGEISK